jgi:hypothetical protein
MSIITGKRLLQGNLFALQNIGRIKCFYPVAKASAQYRIQV